MSDVLKRLQRYALMMGYDGIAKSDLPGLQHHIDNYLIAGWSKDKIFRFLKNCEEVDPQLDEDIALARMKKVIEEM